MSVILGVLARDGAIVASDSQPYDKTFQLKGGILCAWAGQLGAGTASVAEFLNEAIVAAGKLSFKQTVELAADVLKTRLESIPESEVRFQDRVLDIIFACKNSLESLQFIPDASTASIEVKHASNPYFVAAGDNAAKHAIFQQLNANPGLRSFSAKNMRPTIERVMLGAIQACPPDPLQPGTGCEAPVHIRTIA